MSWRTIARWPVIAGLPGNQSVDDHERLALAEGFRRLLMTSGLRGEHEVFPTSVEIEAVASPVCECDTWYRNGGKMHEPAEDRVLDAVDEMTMNKNRAPHWQRMRR